MSSIPPQQFKQQLIHLRSDFNNYLKNHNSKGIPTKDLVVILSKYLKAQPSSIEIILSRCIPKAQITWQQLLMYLHNQLYLQNQVNRMKLIKPSIIDVAYYPECDQHLNQKISDIIAQIKKKNTNYVKFMKKTEFFGFKMLVTVLERQAIFYDCQTKEIIRSVQFRYNNVRNKLLTHHTFKQKHIDTYYNNSRGPDTKDINNPREQKLDKVPPMSRRTDQFPHSYQFKSRKNTVQTQELKNILTSNMKNSKVGSSVCSQSNEFNNAKRSITMLDYSALRRDNTKIYKFGSLQNNKLQKQKNIKKDMLKVRSNDTGQIFKLVTESKIEGSLETIKAYKNSIQTFQKYVQIDKSKLQKQKQLFQEYKEPSTMNMKFDYKKQINILKQKSRQLSFKKKYHQPNSSYQNSSHFYNQKSASSKKSRLSKVRHHTQTQHHQSYQQSIPIINQHNQSAFATLEKKVLQIQSISFCDHYMLVSLMNCELRLYSFKKTIHGFSEEIIFQKSYQSIIMHVSIYRSAVRKMYNICVVFGKFVGEGANQIGSKTQNLGEMRNTSNGIARSKQTQIIVYQLNSSLQIQKQCFQTYLLYTPVISEILPLGLAGFIESGNFFLIQLNSTSGIKSEQKSIDTCLVDSDTGNRVSISALKCHKNLVYLYIGCKDGSIYVYDRLSKAVRIKRKVMNAQIIQVMFVGNSGNEMLLWDASGKIGIIGTENLGINLVIGVMGAVGRDNDGGGGSNHWAMLQYFLENQYLVYGDRTIGVISLYENEQKKFNAEKPIKILNRRQMIKNRAKGVISERINSLTVNQTKQKSIAAQQQLTPLNIKKIHKIFSNPQKLIFSTCSGQIILYNEHSSFIGSYFTLNFLTLTQCIASPSLQYLYLLHQNNQMQVINLYTQQQIINFYNLKQEVLDIFFCDSQIYFCGYLTMKKFNMYVYGYSEGRASKQHHQPLAVVSLMQLVLDTKSLVKTIALEANQNRDSKFSKFSSFSLSTNSNFSDTNIRFYKSSPIIIKSSPPELIFLYKKTYTRNCLIKLLDYISQTLDQSQLQFEQLEPASISCTNILAKSNILTLMLNIGVFVIVNLENKTVKNIYKLKVLESEQKQEKKKSQSGKKRVPKPKQQFNKQNKQRKLSEQNKQAEKHKQPFEHWYEPSTGCLVVVWKVVQQQNTPSYSTSYIYTQYNLPEHSHTESVFYPQFLIHINNQQQKQRNLSDKPSQKNSAQKQVITAKQAAHTVIPNWKSPPFLLSKNLLTISKQYHHININRITVNNLGQAYKTVSIQLQKIQPQ